MDIRVLVFNSGIFYREDLSNMTEKELYNLWVKDFDNEMNQVQMYYLDEFSCAFNDEEVSDQDWLYFVDFDNVKETENVVANNPLTKSDVIKKVTGQIANMMYNDITCEYGVSGFESWCSDGDMFDDISEEDKKRCMDLVEKVAPIVDDLIYNFLNIDDAAKEEHRELMNK